MLHFNYAGIKSKWIQHGIIAFAACACVTAWSATVKPIFDRSVDYWVEATQDIPIEINTTQSQSLINVNVLVTPQILSVTLPSTIGCQAAHLEQDAKNPVVMIPIGDDLIIPIGGVLQASWLPPQPSNPNETIVGVDSDGDCVRDDIERYITNLYPKKSDYLLRENLFRYAIWMNQFLNLPPVLTELRAQIALTNMRIAGQCVNNILGDEVGGEALSNLFAQFHNTWDRSDKYVYNMVNYISGWTTREDPIIMCN